MWVGFETSKCTARNRLIAVIAKTVIQWYRQFCRLDIVLESWICKNGHSGLQCCQTRVIRQDLINRVVTKVLSGYFDRLCSRMLPDKLIACFSSTVFWSVLYGRICPSVMSNDCAFCAQSKWVLLDVILWSASVWRVDRRAEAGQFLRIWWKMSIKVSARACSSKIYGAKSNQTHCFGLKKQKFKPQLPAALNALLCPLTQIDFNYLIPGCILLLSRTTLFNRPLRRTCKPIVWRQIHI